MKPIVHWSDCAVYNEPAFPAGPCDCGAAKAHKKWWSYAHHLFYIRVSALKIRLGSWLGQLFCRLSSFSNPAICPKNYPANLITAECFVSGASQAETVRFYNAMIPVISKRQDFLFSYCLDNGLVHMPSFWGLKFILSYNDKLSRRSEAEIGLERFVTHFLF